MAQDGNIEFWKNQCKKKGKLALFGTVAASLIGCAYAEYSSNKREIETIKKILSIAKPIEQRSIEIDSSDLDAVHKLRIDTIGYMVPKKVFE